MLRTIALLVWTFTCSLAYAQTDSNSAPIAPCKLSFNSIAVVKVINVGQEPTLAVLKFSSEPSKEKTEISFKVEKRTRTVIINGKETEQEYNVSIPIASVKQSSFTPTRNERTYPVNKAQVFDITGKLVAQEVWMKALANPKHVLLLHEPFSEENPLDPFYMTIIREDTLFVYLPNLEAEKKGE